MLTNLCSNLIENNQLQKLIMISLLLLLHYRYLLQTGMQGMHIGNRGTARMNIHSSPDIQHGFNYVDTSTPRFKPPSRGNSTPIMINPYTDNLLDIAAVYGVSDKMEYDARMHRSAAG